MKVIELYHLLRTVIAANVENGQKQIRIGDQNESGPYEHAPVGGVFRGTDSEVIICADPDADWDEEETGIGHELPTLWSPGD